MKESDLSGGQKEEPEIWIISKWIGFLCKDVVKSLAAIQYDRGALTSEWTFDGLFFEVYVEEGRSWNLSIGSDTTGLAVHLFVSRPSLPSIRPSISEEAWLDPYREPNLTCPLPKAAHLSMDTPNSFKALPHIVQLCDPETLTY